MPTTTTSTAVTGGTKVAPILLSRNICTFCASMFNKNGAYVSGQRYVRTESGVKLKGGNVRTGLSSH